MKKTIHDTVSDVVRKAILEVQAGEGYIKGLNIGTESYRLLLEECRGCEVLSGIAFTSMFGLPIAIDESDPYSIYVEIAGRFEGESFYD